ncbi:MAG: hypothetical protein M1816_006794 [Peltula sp. TS41687]|nr:MAG: hypothetical protein M1816_006794 [Peltula sp. TS41687]
MKFAHEFQEVLKNEDFPAPWAQSAISYSQLKKCIKKLQRELSDLGLDAPTLSQLLVPEGGGRDVLSEHSEGRPLFQYSFVENTEHPRPQLYFIVDTRDGELVDASLSDETRAYLRNVVRKRASSQAGNDDANLDVDNRMCDVNPDTIQGGSQSDIGGITNGRIEEILNLQDGPMLESTTTLDTREIVGQPKITRIKVPLTFDSEFFGLLENGLCGVDYLQQQEQSQMTEEVREIGRMVSRVAIPSRSSSDLARWREIFELYIQANIFFSTSEQDHGIRSAAAATKQLQWFSDEATKDPAGNHFKSPDSHIVLDQFMRLNVRLIRNLKFQEINQTAMLKILKKFDKRTALGVKTTFPEVVAGRPFLARTIAKAVCFQLTQDVLSTVPQLNDYLCPVCFNIAYKPIRLCCGHIFCIRCMITMQRARDTHCPLCRGSVVMEADSSNLDPALMNFLKTYFPKEVKVKQKENERALAIDKWGDDFDKCTFM